MPPPDRADADPQVPGGPIRLDRWLWHARFFRSRSLAAAAVAGGRMRLNGRIVEKPAQAVRAGDVLTFALGRRIVVVRVLAPGHRRGPAPEARALYEDLSPPPEAEVRDRSGGAGGPSRGARNGRGAPGSGRVD
jgi:ribosome-associated heat shock protein Hsp15